MLLHRLEFELTLVVKAPLTLGTGLMTPAGTAEEPRNVIEIHKDKAENAYIPATSLKGALRAAYNGADEDAIFGKIKNEKTGNMGRLLLYAATSEVKKPEERTLNSINRKTGTAKDHHLFKLSAVAEGSKFKLSGLLMLQDGDDSKTIITNILFPLLEGVSLGKGTRAGFGRVVIEKNSLNCVERKLNFQDLSLSKTPLEISFTQKDTIAAFLTFTLLCKDAYLSLDPIRKIVKQGDKEVEITSYLHRNTQPLLLGSSLLGAMRARAAWLWELQELRANGETAQELDRRFTKNIDITQLSPVERLFGVAGFKGVLSLKSLPVGDKKAIRKATHIAIDRFTGGSLDSALLNIEAAEGVTFKPEFLLDPRAVEGDKVFLKILIQYLQENGLMLGYGAAKGYGWFKLENVQW